MKRLLLKLLFSFYFFTFIISFTVFVFMSIIIISLNNYNSYLQDMYAKKQPHIIIKYINDNEKINIKKVMQKIKKLLKNQISAVNTFTETYKTIKLQHNLNYFYGNLKIIGLGCEEYPITYNFADIAPRQTPQYAPIKFTQIELFDSFRHSQSEFFNKALQKSFSYPPSMAMSFGMFYKDKKIASINFYGEINDLKSEPILFMNRKKFNKIFHYPQNHINGFYINIKNQNRLFEIKKLLQKNFKNATVLTWRDINIKQNSILNIFSKIAYFIGIILFLLALGAVSVILYTSVIKKQYQIRIIKKFGLNIENKIILLQVVTLLSADLLGIAAGCFIGGKFGLKPVFHGYIFILTVVNIILSVCITKKILSKNIKLLG